MYAESNARTVPRDIIIIFIVHYILRVQYAAGIEDARELDFNGRR